MNQKLLKKLGIVEDRTSSQLQRLTHTKTGMTLVHQPYMSTRQWEDDVNDFVRRTSIAHVTAAEPLKATKKPRARPLKKFGHGGTALQHGSLSHHIGWLEALANDEEENMAPSTTSGPAFDRLEKVHDAIQLLNEAVNMSKGDQE